MIKEVNLLKIELKFDIEREAMSVESIYTKILKDLVDETNSEVELAETLCKIEELLENLMNKLDKNIPEEEVENV